MKNYTCYLISNKPEFYNTIRNSIYPEELVFFNGEGFPSFSKLVNTCVESCPTEIVILMSYKVLPTADHVKKIVDLINEGYGLVGLYRFGFFGFKKQLMRQIGMMDERFVGGGYEDEDMYIRLKEANISMYITEEVEYTKSSSSWNYNLSKPHFMNKWIDTKNPLYSPLAKPSAAWVKRKIDEVTLDYNLGKEVPTSFLTWEHTVAQPSKSRKYVQGPKR
mgnify:CR=1 FL=1